MSKGELSGECPLLKVSNILSVSLCPLLREMLEKMVPKVIQEKRYSLVKYRRVCARARILLSVFGVGREVGRPGTEKPPGLENSSIEKVIGP